MGQTTVDKVGQLDGLYQIAGDDVRAFLAERPETVGFLIDARPHIEEQFGKDVVVELRFPRNYEDDLQDYLLAMIRYSPDPGDGLDRWDRLWREWLGDATSVPRSWEVTIGID
jgi:hypothetical protein